jgi:3-(3-hydroxy-phenyl)propionate hydroxylase
MAPPHHGFSLLRDAALRLATEVGAARALLNPRQSTPVEYVGSTLNSDAPGQSSSSVRAGMPAPEALLEGITGGMHITKMFGAGFVLLCYSANGEVPRELSALARNRVPSPASLTVVCIASVGEPATNVYVDCMGQFRARYVAAAGSVYLVRPDGYLAACWKACGVADVRAALAACGNTEHGG